MRLRALKRAGLLLSMCLLLNGVSVANAAPPRRALVIGNNAYQHIKKLDNPVNDADGMAAALSQSGFTVVKKTDVGQQAMEEAIRQFVRDVSPNEVALFYYAGHGIQVNGVNYLLPVDAKIGLESEVKYKAVDVGLVLDGLLEAGSRVNIIILDACRDNPFRGLRSLQRGLVAMLAPTDAQTFIAYATAPGTTAADGSGDHSPYTQSLLAAIKTPGLPIESLFKQVRIAVKKATADQTTPQTPWEASSLTEEFSFAITPPSTPSTSSGQVPLRVTATPVAQQPTPVPSQEGNKEKIPSLEGKPKPTAVKRLRSESLVVSADEAQKMFGLDKGWRPREYLKNDFEVQGDVVIDAATGLTWQKFGSPNEITYRDAQAYIDKLNRERFGGYADWRLPTIPELISLLEPTKKNGDLYIAPVFDKTQRWCWSTDLRIKSESSSESAWTVYFDDSVVYWVSLKGYVRAVRSGQ